MSLASVLGAAVVYGTIPDSAGVIHGCYKTGSGTLRVIDTGAGDLCLQGEASLTWNATGPQGPPGPSDAWSSVPGGFVNLLPNTTGLFTPVASLALPAGRFFVIGTATLLDSYNGAHCRCRITTSNGEVARSQMTLDTPTQFVSLTVQRAFVLPVPDTVTLECVAGIQSNARDMVLTAIQVGALH